LAFLLTELTDCY